MREKTDMIGKRKLERYATCGCLWRGTMREESDMTRNWVRGCRCAMFCGREALYALRYGSVKSGKID